MKKLGLIYAVIALLSGMYFYSEARYECIKEVGFIEGYFVGCDGLSTTVLLLHEPPSLLKSQLKGIIWPYFLFFSDGDHAKDTFDNTLEELAKYLVEEENKRSGRKVGALLTFDHAELEGKVISFYYFVNQRTMEAMRQPYNKKIVYDDQIQTFCENDGSNTYKIIQTLLKGGYQFSLLFQTPNDSINLSISKCD